MNKQTLKKLFSLPLVLIFISTSLFLYLKYNPTQSKVILIQFSDKAITTTCPNSPSPKRYQECFRSQIGKSLALANPTDLLAIIETTKDLKDKDLFLSDSKEEKFLTKLFYFENWSIILDYSKSLNIRRDGLSFLDIIFIPYVKKKMKYEIYELQDSFKKFTMEIPQSIETEYSTRVKLINKKFGQKVNE